MNLKIIKKKIVLKYLKSNSRIRNVDHGEDLQKITKVGILAESELFQTYDFTKSLSVNFGLDIENFEIILYQNSKINDNLNNYGHFSEKDFSMFGKMTGEDLKKFVAKKFDLLINYCTHEDVFSEVLCVKSKAKLVAGFKNKTYDNYDISISIESNKIDTFNEELTKYLQILKVL
jgi:uncharacterized membrane protein